MTAIRTLLVMAAAAMTVGFFLFVGYAIATHDTGPAVRGAGLLVLAFLATVAQSRLPERSAGH